MIGQIYRQFLTIFTSFVKFNTFSQKYFQTYHKDKGPPDIYREGLFL